MKNLSLLDVNFQSIGVIAVNMDGLITSVNGKAKEIIGLDSSLILGQRLDLVIDDYAIKEMLAAKTQLSKLKVLLNGKHVCISSHRINDGHIAAILEICHVSGNNEDFTNTIYNGNDFRLIVDNSSDGIFVTDGEGKIMVCNPTSERNIGAREEDIVGKSVFDLEQEGYFNPSVIALALNRKEKVTILQDTRTGKKLIAAANPVFSNGKIVKVISNSRDITELLELKHEFLKEKELANYYKKELEKHKYFSEEIVAESSSMRQIINMVSKVAAYDTTIMLLGESGVGKNVIAGLLHKMSPRADRSFIHLNCSAIPANLLESELFGYEPGAFSGAKKEGNMGKIELANKGTLFLDEIADLPLQLQPKLLQVLNEKSFMKVGGSKLINVDVRIISATNKDLEKLVSLNEFREDLYYRLNVIKIKIPSLRDRKEDIPILIKFYLDFYCGKYKISRALSHNALKLMESYDWPGNIRELRNVVEQLVVLTPENIIQEENVKFALNRDIKRKIIDENQVKPLNCLIEELEKEVILRLYSKYKSTYKVARALEISQSSVVRKIKKYKTSHI